MNKPHSLASLALAAGLVGAPLAAHAAPKLAAGAVVAAADPAAKTEFEVFLPLRDAAGLEGLLQAQHSPGNSKYHAWLTPAQFAAQFGPAPDAVNRVKAALGQAGLTVIASNPRSVRVSGDVAHVAALLHANLASVTEPQRAARLMAQGQIALPAALQAEGAQVVAFTPIPRMHVNSVRGPVATPQNRYTTVGGYWFDDLKQAYSYPARSVTVTPPHGAPKTTVTDGAGVKVAVLMADLIFPGDVDAMFNHENFTAISGAPAPAVNTVTVDGGGVYNGYGAVEASLDVQQVAGGAPGASVTLVSIPDLSDQHIVDGYTAIVNSNAYDIVNSSFGGCELEYTAAYNGGTDYTYILQIYHQIFQQGNAQGITFVASSGDQGALACPGVNYAPGVNSTFVAGVETPAADPSVTSVGGGNLVTSAGAGLNSSYVRESAYGDPQYPYDVYGIGATVSGGYWGATGGVSAVFAKPSYQALATTGSATMRTVPDVGMQVGGMAFSQLDGTAPGYCNTGTISCSADGSSVKIAYGVNYGGGFYHLIGTSVSSPEFAGALALFEQTAHRQGNVNFYLYNAGHQQTQAGGKTAPAPLQYFHRGMQGFDGVYAGGYPSANYDYIYGLGSPNVANLFHITPLSLAGTPQTGSNP